MTLKGDTATIRLQIEKILKDKGYPRADIDEIFEANHNNMESIYFIAQIISPYAKGQYEFSKC